MNRPTLDELSGISDMQDNWLAIPSKEVNERYEQIRSRSGVLNIADREFRAELKDIEEIGELGRGAFGVVRKARFKKTGSLMAVKIMPATGDAESNKRMVMDMDVIMRSHSCPHIVRCYGCFVFESEVRICMELMTMCLGKLLKIAKQFPEEIVGKVTVAVLDALNYLKEKERIMHRDIKPSNILVDMNGNIKLCDFGIAGRLIDTMHAESDSRGCMAYLAPERIGSSRIYGVRSDVWSFGITLFELITGVHPYAECQTDFELLTKIKSESPPKIDSSFGCSKLFVAFVAKCLRKNDKERPNYQELLADPFVITSQRSQTDVGRWVQEQLQS
ncbi:hypothetical protein AB6A40_003262 [Gnathostoma spinigerum]|uniref:mitogen-activated protein kinase kinase n=1 Tax=Gnathostoma spinigerum TaxID=75299 RepID=A0ABD6E912_9BILA